MAKNHVKRKALFTGKPKKLTFPHPPNAQGVTGSAGRTVKKWTFTYDAGGSAKCYNILGM